MRIHNNNARGHICSTKPIASTTEMIGRRLTGMPWWISTIMFLSTLICISRQAPKANYDVYISYRMWLASATKSSKTMLAATKDWAHVRWSSILTQKSRAIMLLWYLFSRKGLRSAIWSALTFVYAQQKDDWMETMTNNNFETCGSSSPPIQSSLCSYRCYRCGL